MAGEETEGTVVRGKGKRHRRNRSGRRKRFVRARQRFYLHFKMTDPDDPSKLIDFPEGVRVRLMNNGKPVPNVGSTSKTDANGKVTLAPNRRTIRSKPNYHFRIDLDERTYYDIDSKKLVKSTTIKEQDDRNLMEIPMVIDTKDKGFHYDESKLKLEDGMLKKYKRRKKGEGTESDPVVLEVHFYWYYLKFKYYNVIKDGDAQLDVPRGMPIVSKVDNDDYLSRYLKDQIELGYGISSDDIRLLHYLKLLGFYKGKIPGGSSKELKKAIKKFQKQYGLKDSGIPDIDTQKKLEHLFSRRSICVFKDDSYWIPAWKKLGGFTKVYFEMAQPACKFFSADEASKFDLFLHTKDKDSEPKLIYRKKIEEDNKDKDKKGIPFEKLEFLRARQYYDLPAKWSSRNYWTRHDNDMKKGERFDVTMKDKVKLYPFDNDENKRADKTKPLMFSLDDIVMVKDVGANKGTQDIQDKNASDASAPFKKDTAGKKDGSRMTLFHVKDEDLVVFDQEEAKQGYFSKAHAKAANLTANLITNAPKYARLVAFANDFYDVYNKRTAQKKEHFDPAKHVLGCRAAVKDDKDCHFGQGLMFKNPNPLGHNLYFANGTGNFELHYINNGCPVKGPDGLKIRSFLLIYWNGRFASAPAPKSVSSARVRTFEVEGTKNAKERWENKGYTLEPQKKVKDGGKCFMQIKPVFFFEGKKSGIGGKEKCKVTVSSDSSTGWMRTTTSDMYWKDYKINNYLFTHNPAVAKFKDIDGRRYEQLTVAHELGHAEGKLDDYSKWWGPYGWPTLPEDKTFSQWYFGMPYQFDDGSMMLDNRAPRMRHFYNFSNWVNDYSKDNSGLKNFLNDSQFELVNRFGKKILRYSMTNPVRDICKSYKTKRRYNLSTGSVDMAVYKLGKDETAHNLTIKKKKPLPPKDGFDAILIISMKIGITFKNGSAGNWGTNTAGIRDDNDWRRNLYKALNKLNGRFYLKGSGDHEFKKTYLGLYPMVFVMNGPDASTHYDIEVTLNGSSSISHKSGKTVNVGDEVNKNWLANYILGDDDGGFVAFFKWTLGLWSFGDDEIEFARNWLRSSSGLDDKSFKIKDSLW